MSGAKALNGSALAADDVASAANLAPRASLIARAVCARAKLEAPITPMFTGSMCPPRHFHRSNIQDS